MGISTVDQYKQPPVNQISRQTRSLQPHRALKAVVTQHLGFRIAAYCLDPPGAKLLIVDKRLIGYLRGCSARQHKILRQGLLTLQIGSKVDEISLSAMPFAFELIFINSWYALY